MTLALHQRVKPLGVAGALDADRDGTPQGRVEVLDRLIVVHKATCLHLTCLRVEHCDVLLPGVQIASDECHGAGPPLSLRCDRSKRSTAQPTTREGNLVLMTS